MSESWGELGNLVIPNMQAYCKKHGYHFDIWVIPPKFEFEKIKMILNLLEDGIDTIFCLDLDTLITNHNIKVESFLDDDHDFYLTKDINTWNTGSIIVRNTEWAQDWLDYILNHQGEIENEQTVIMRDMRVGDLPKVRVLSHPSINSYPYEEYAPTWGLIEGWEPTTGSKEKPTHEQGDWQVGDFVAHLPGLPVARRIEIFNRMKEQIIL